MSWLILFYSIKEEIICYQTKCPQLKYSWSLRCVNTLTLSPKNLLITDEFCSLFVVHGIQCLILRWLTVNYSHSFWIQVDYLNYRQATVKVNKKIIFSLLIGTYLHKFSFCLLFLLLVDCAQALLMVRLGRLDYFVRT